MGKILWLQAVGDCCHHLVYFKEKMGIFEVRLKKPDKKAFPVIILKEFINFSKIDLSG